MSAKVLSMRYLVTGGAGFIGSNRSNNYSMKGTKAIVPNNYAAGKKPERHYDGATYVEGDIRDETRLVRLCRASRAFFTLLRCRGFLIPLNSPG